MAENFGHLNPRGSSGSSQSIIKMAYGITELCMRRDWFTENTRTTNAIFQFAKIENHSVIFQLYFSWKTYSKNKFFTFHSERYRFATSDPVKALETPADHQQNNHRLHIARGKTKNQTTLHNLPKSIHKMQLKPNLNNKKSDLGLKNLPFTSAVKNRTQRNKSWEERQTCHAVPVPFHYKKGEEFLGFAPYSQPKTRHVWYQNF